MPLPPELSPSIRAWAGGFVRASEPRFTAISGGFGAGLRGRVSGRGGAVFFKVTPTHALSADDDRIEAVVLPDLPPQVGAPQLLGTTEQEGWHITVSEYVEGEPPPEPWRQGDLTQVLDHVVSMHEALARHPAPRVPTVAERMRGRATTWSRLVSGNDPRLDDEPLSAWERAHVERLAEAEAAFAKLVADDHLVHFDLRHDNILVTSTGGVRILDWGRASTGPAWVDVVCLLLESRVDAPALQPLFAGATATLAPDPGAVDSFLATLASYWRGAISEHRDAPAALTLRRRWSLAATEEWLADRWR